jgi:hypothetical protein
MTVYAYTFAGANGAVWPLSGEIAAGNVSAGTGGDYLLDGAGNLTNNIAFSRITSPNSGAWSQTSRTIESTIGAAVGNITYHVSNVNGLLFVELNIGTGAWAIYEFSSAFSGTRASGTISTASPIGKKLEARLQGLNLVFTYDGTNIFTPFAHNLNIATSILQFELANGAKISALRIADQFTSAQPAPSAITFSAVSDVAITATVASDPDYQQYVLERKVGAGAYSVVATQTSNIFVQTGLTATTSYDYRAKAICADGETDYSTVFSQATQNPLGGGGTLPPPPSPLPSITGGPFTVEEGTGVIGPFTITDFDQSSGHSIAISGPDAALFTVGAVAGQPMQRVLLKSPAFSYANPEDVGLNNVYNVTLTVTDSSSNVSAGLPVVITVTEALKVSVRENETADITLTGSTVAVWCENDSIAQVLNIDNVLTTDREFRVIGRGAGRTNLVVQTASGLRLIPVTVKPALPSALLSIRTEPQSVQGFVGASIALKAILQAANVGDVEGLTVTWEKLPSGSGVGNLTVPTTTALANGTAINSFNATAAGSLVVLVKALGRETPIAITIT